MDYLFSFEGGMNAGVSPLILAKNQLPWASGSTVRNGFIHSRPPRQQYAFDLSAVPTFESLILSGLWLFQGSCYYQADSGPESLIASISGRLFKFTPDPTTKIATVIEVTGGNPQSATALQCWLWQAENYVIWNDGINLPVFFNGTNTARSRGGTGAGPPTYVVANPFTGIGPGTPISLTYTFQGSNGDTVTLSPGTGSDKLGVVASGAGTQNIVVNFGITDPNYFVASGTQLLDTASTAASSLSQTVVINNNYDTTTSLTFNLTNAYNGSANVIISNGTNFPLQGVVTAGIGTNVLQIKFPILSSQTSTLYIGPNITIGKGQILIDAAQAPQTAALAPQFPAGRMGAYGRGRIWMALANGKDFIAGDIVGGSSGTLALNFRDAILNITENNYLVGGGLFTVPGSIGDIRAMIFTAQLDVALGQGPLQVFTPKTVFSCNAPVDRLTWQSLTNPILTESAIGNGGLGQYSTFNVNSDVFYRAVDGIRSLILASQDFNQWIRTPISHEVEKLLQRDNQSLLAFGSGVFFDNRSLMTAAPVSTVNGVYHQALVAQNSDLITSLRDKQPPAYDGIWPGMNILQMMTGEFALVERSFQFVYNTVQKSLELWELLPESASDVENLGVTPVIGDNGSQAIEWWFESSALFRDNSPTDRFFKALNNGEIFVDKLVGRVDFQVFYKPDQYPCWTPWLSWSECATQKSSASDNIKPQFRPRMGLGTPSATPCDPSTNRRMREGFTFQVKIVITGQCEFLGARFEAIVLPQPTFAPPACKPLC
jgi:hypothetical protein